MRVVLATAVVAALALAGPACSRAGPRGLPPDDAGRLAAVIDPLVAPLELHFTRGSVEDRDGHHLALYVAPVTAFSDQRFVDTILPLARAVTPVVFARWPGLNSYDICQEPSPGVDDRPQPESQTVFDVSRRYAAGVPWDRVDLRSLVADSEHHRPGIAVAVQSRLFPAFTAATG